jgi:hypothetical protein
MTSKNEAHMASHQVNNDTLHSHHHSNPLSILTAAAREPLRKLFKTSSDHSAKSSATDATTIEKCVTFEKRSMFRNTLSIKDYTPDEVRATWYTREDVRRISRQCQKEIRKMNKGDKLKDKKYCSRGLEGRTNDGLALKKQERVLSISTVLKEQMGQWDEGVFDEDAIAAIDIRASSSCQMWANFVGQQDQKAIERYLRSLSTRRSTAGLARSSAVSAAA